jgi:hypothetical protein
MSSFKHYRVNHDSQHAVMKDTQEDVPGTFIEDLHQNLQISLVSLTKDDIEFDLIGVDASIANALRRIMLAEVPTMAVEYAFITVNNSIIQDEVLSHRIGLIPFLVDAKDFDYAPPGETEVFETQGLVFELDVQCPPLPDDVEYDEDRLPILTPEQRRDQVRRSERREDAPCCNTATSESPLCSAVVAVRAVEGPAVVPPRGASAAGLRQPRPPAARPRRHRHRQTLPGTGTACFVFFCQRVILPGGLHVCVWPEDRVGGPPAERHRERPHQVLPVGEPLSPDSLFRNTINLCLTTVFLDQATASYRLMPDITLLQPVTGDLATQLVDMCPMKVFDIEDIAIGTLRMFTVRWCCEGSTFVWCAMCRRREKGQGGQQ